MSALRKWWDGQATWYLNPNTRILSRTRDGVTDYPDGPEAERARKHFARRARAASNRKERDECGRLWGCRCSTHIARGE